MFCHSFSEKSALLDTLKTGAPYTGVLGNSEDPDEMPHNAAFHQGLHCLLRQNRSQRKNIILVLEIITSDPLIYTMDILTLLHEILCKIPLVLKGLQMKRVGAQCFSGRVLDSRPKGRGFEAHRRHCVVVLE